MFAEEASHLFRYRVDMSSQCESAVLAGRPVLLWNSAGEMFMHGEVSRTYIVRSNQCVARVSKGSTCTAAHQKVIHPDIEKA